MLRQKMVLVFGSLVVLLLITAVGAIWALQDILIGLRHLNTEAWGVVDRSNELAITISKVEITLYELELGRERHLDTLLDAVEEIEEQVASVRDSYVCRLPENAPILQRILEQLPVFTRHVAALGTAQDEEWATRHRREALRSAVQLRQDILILTRNVRTHGDAEQALLTSRFRWLVLGLIVVFLLLINASVFALLRTATMVLKPVEKLVEATRQLGQERFDFRVELDQKDEFDELARAYNHLAAQLQSNEQRKLETLGQVALTLNHELNNAAAIIELQLKLLGRQAEGNTAVEKYARQIHESLRRMTDTVELLKRVRRIVLTDYVSGVKMLDLQRSVQGGEAADAPEATEKR